MRSLQSWQLAGWSFFPQYALTNCPSRSSTDSEGFWVPADGFFFFRVPSDGHFFLAEGFCRFTCSSLTDSEGLRVPADGLFFPKDFRVPAGEHFFRAEVSRGFLAEGLRGFRRTDFFLGGESSGFTSRTGDNVTSPVLVSLSLGGRGRGNIILNLRILHSQTKKASAYYFWKKALVKRAPVLTVFLMNLTFGASWFSAIHCWGPISNGPNENSLAWNNGRKIRCDKLLQCCALHTKAVT